MASRRDFLQTLGHAASASVAAISVDGVDAVPAARRRRRPVRIPISISCSSIRGSSSAPTTPRRSSSARPISARAPARRSARSCRTSSTSRSRTPRCVMGSTDVTVDQGGSGGSDALQTDGYPMRRVAAEARRVLLDMASAHFGVPVDVARGQRRRDQHQAGDTADRSITYGELIGGKKFNVTLTGRNIDATTGTAPLKPVQAHEERRPVAAPRRHSGEGERHAALGRGHESAGHAARAQRPAAGGRRHARRRSTNRP